MRKTISKAFLIATGILVLASGRAFADNSTASCLVDGISLDQSGVALDGTFDVTVSVYDALTAGNVISTNTDTAVVFDKGIFQAPYDCANLEGDVFLEIKIGDQILEPRTQVFSVARAKMADVAGSLLNPIAGTQISAGAVTTSQLGDASVTGSKIHDGTITNSNIQANTLDFSSLSDSLTLDAPTTVMMSGANYITYTNVDTSTVTPVVITNTGTGNSFVVEDQASDPSPFVIDKDGNVGIGAFPPAIVTNMTAAALTVERENAPNGIILRKYGTIYDNSSFNGQQINGTKAVPLPVSKDTTLMSLSGEGYDGSDPDSLKALYTGSAISINAAEDWSSTAHGTSVQLYTTRNGTTDLQPRMKIDASGNMQISPNSSGLSTVITAALEVDGPIATPLNFVHADYTVTDVDSIVIVDQSVSPITITLPTPVGKRGRQYTIRNAILSTVTITSQGGENVNGATNILPNYTLSAQGKFADVVSNGYDWYVVRNN